MAGFPCTRTGFEPARLSAAPPQSSASANSATLGVSDCRGGLYAGRIALQSQHIPKRPRSDSNRRITDLQSVPLVHLGTRPRFSDNIAVLHVRQVRARTGSAGPQTGYAALSMYQMKGHCFCCSMMIATMELISAISSANPPSARGRR